MLTPSNFQSFIPLGSPSAAYVTGGEHGATRSQIETTISFHGN